MAMKTFNVGDVLGAADVTEYLENTRFAFKPSDTTRNSHPSATNDPDLSVPVDANKIYMIYCALSYNSPSTPGFNVGLSTPTGTVLGGTLAANYSVVGAQIGNLSAVSGSSTVTPEGASGDLGVLMVGIVNTGSSSGNVVVQWGQATSSASNTVLRAQSCLFLRRVS